MPHRSSPQPSPSSRPHLLVHDLRDAVHKLHHILLKHLGGVCGAGQDREGMALVGQAGRQCQRARQMSFCPFREVQAASGRRQG